MTIAIILVNIMFCAITSGAAVYRYGNREYGLAAYNAGAAVWCGLIVIVLAIQTGAA